MPIPRNPDHACGSGSVERSLTREIFRPLLKPVHEKERKGTLENYDFRQRRI